MTKAELINRLIAARTGDTERDHAAADAALVDFIDDPDVTQAYAAIAKWYA